MNILIVTIILKILIIICEISWSGITGYWLGDFANRNNWSKIKFGISAFFLIMFNVIVMSTINFVIL